MIALAPNSIPSTVRHLVERCPTCNGEENLAGFRSYCAVCQGIGIVLLVSPDQPCPYLPGSLEKLAFFRARIANELPLTFDGDNDGTVYFPSLLKRSAAKEELLANRLESFLKSNRAVLSCNRIAEKLRVTPHTLCNVARANPQLFDFRRGSLTLCSK